MKHKVLTQLKSTPHKKENNYEGKRNEKMKKKNDASEALLDYKDYAQGPNKRKGC